MLRSVGECAYFIDGATDVDLDKLDKYIANLLDASCNLKRINTGYIQTKNKKYRLQEHSAVAVSFITRPLHIGKMWISLR